MPDSESDHSSVGTDEEKPEQTIASTLVVTKYNMAAEVANCAIAAVIKECVAGKKAGDLCDLGDEYIVTNTAKVFKKEKDLKRGIAFPTCVSINNVICHYSPLKDDEMELKDGDMVKVDLGVHIDGFISTVAQTVVVGASASNKVTGKKADAIWAAYNAMEMTLRMLRPKQHKNTEVTDAISRLVDSYGCKPVENMLSHQLKHDKIDGEKQIIQNPGEKQRSDMDKCEFDENEVYAIDVLVSTGEGKARDTDRRTTVYKKSDDIIYQLKMKHARVFFSDINKAHGNMPFTLRSIEEISKAKLGVKECVEHGLMKPYPVLSEREGDYVAQFKCTVLVMPTGLLKITGLSAPDPNVYSTERKIEDEKLAKLVTESLKPKKKKAKKDEKK